MRTALDNFVCVQVHEHVYRHASAAFLPDPVVSPGYPVSLLSVATILPCGSRLLLFAQRGEMTNAIANTLTLLPAVYTRHVSMSTTYRGYHIV